ncbi:MAG: hypothetical protein V4547_04380 [Bacteroidota bacterium]
MELFQTTTGLFLVNFLICVLFVGTIVVSQAQHQRKLIYEFKFLNPKLVNKYLEPFKGCLIQLTNNPNLDIPNVKVPIISRYINFERKTHLPKLIKLPETHQSIYRVFYYLPKSNQSLAFDRLGNVFNFTANLTSVSSEKYYSNIFGCQRSRFVNGGPEFGNTYGLCTKINFYKFSGKIRPWKCEVYLNIFPNDSYYSTWDLSNYWHWEYDPDNLAPSHVRQREFVPQALSPISIPRIHMLLLPYQKYIKKSKIIRNWVANETYVTLRVMGKLDIFLGIEVKVQMNSKNGLNWFNKLTLVHRDSKSLNFYEMSIKLFSSESLENVPEYLTSRVSDWEFNLYRSYVNLPLQCYLSRLPVEQHESKVKLMDLEEVQKYEFDLMLNFILKNGSNSNACLGESKKYEYYVIVENRMLHNSSIPSNVFVTNYRFVSCGRSEDTALPFYELVSSFQGSLWGTIVFVVILVVPLTLSYFPIQVSGCNQSHNQNIIDMLISSLKLIFEQGNPFTTTTINTPSLKWILSAVFLACLVISNAYKRDNILKMIQPRGKVPYEFFSQLVQHSFEIYTRASRVTQTWLKCESKDDQCRNGNFLMINPHFYSNNYWRVRSDVLQFQEANTTFFDLLYKHTKILPETISEIMQRKSSSGKMSVCRFLSSF